MKKIGLLIFAAAIILGVLVSSIFSFGRIDQNIFSFSFKKKTRGSGKIVTESRDVKGFKGVDVGGIFDVEIVAAQSDFAVEVEADDNLLRYIKTEVRDGILHIESERRISTRSTMKIRVAAPDIDSVEASGVSKVRLTGVKNSELRVDTSGASKVSVGGETARAVIEVSGASSVNAESLKAEAASVNASGASRVSVFATAELRSDASGASKITYAGNPKTIETSSSGAGSVSER